MQQDCSEESWLEEQCHREINAQHDEHERDYVRNRDSALSNVWGAFQDSATAVAHLYRGGLKHLLLHKMQTIFF